MQPIRSELENYSTIRSDITITKGVKYLLLLYILFSVKVVDAMFKDIWHPVTVNGEEEHPARMFIGDAVVSYTSKDNISSIDPISVILPGYNQNRVDAILQGIENDTNETLYIFLGTAPIIYCHLRMLITFNVMLESY